ncbi:hypothetical protein NKK48_07030 [Mesorhizobium sp. C386A]|uniref:hypothetical protein n=1 Tax=unclassified Mesorhizobium TaxID=325217 RepID=UPI0003CEF371|nr:MULTISPECIES: hypothetical protein [unclassified Mesorhizobium]ESY05444.1 hypothetical protein X752_25315 [Mesorhizobium sp. LNJC398B00]ESY38990.1 hypothetical protein X748_06180 [Mesorhizobium sp. LNJC386A00]
MGKSFRTISFAIFVVFVTGDAFAQCAREGEALCQNGQTYRCEKTGSELTPIFQNVPCVVNATGLNGIWTGSGHQSPAGAAGADWAIAMTIGDGAASIDYPSLGCGGSLTQISRDDSSAEYRENISYGQDKCIDGGGITVRFFKGNLSWTWVGQADGQPYNAVAVLKRR